MKKLILIDGNNLVFRSYYATAYNGNVMRNSKGFPTNALYGLVNMLNKILAEEKPIYAMIAFDKGKTFRHEKYADYKAGRSETPDELKQQFPVAKQLVEAMGFKYFEIDNYEADDIIGTFVKKAEQDDEFDSTIISSDKDLLQLISSETDVKLLKQVGNIRMNEETFIETYGINPINMIDLKALMGDPSDNIPGVKGIGEKTALSLLKKYKTLDGVYQNIDGIKGKLKEKLIDGKESAYKSYDLVTIYRDVPIDTDFEKIKYRGIDTLKYIDLLKELEFYSLIKKLDIREEDMRSNKEKSSELTIKIVENMDEVVIDSDFAIYVETFGYNYHKDPVIAFTIYDGKNAYYIPKDVMLTNPSILTSEYKKSTYDLKKLLVILNNLNLEITNCDFDMMIACYLLNYTIKDDIAYYINSCGVDVEFYEKEFGSLAKLKMPSLEVLSKNAMIKAKFIYDNRDKLYEKLKEEEALYLFDKLEMPLTYVLADMEEEGIRVNVDYLLKLGEEFTKRLDELSKEIYAITKEEFNIASPLQLGEMLFEKMQLPYPKKYNGKRYSTSKDVLDKVRHLSPVIDLIEEHRMISKLYSVYVISLKNEVMEDGKVHTTFNQTLTRTGRLSSSNPNLQNIPVRTEYSKLIRKAFVPEENALILSSDYSQIELRIFAHMSNATNLIEAFKSGKDIHAKTASDIFHKPIEQVTSDERRQAKAVNFGILYGMSSFGLSEDLKVDIATAKKFMDNYLNTFTGIKEYMQDVIDDAHEKGYVKTLMNRKRIIEELNNKNYMIRSSGERMALNTPVQGSSADILKKAMVEIYQELNKRKLKSKMIIQVHDELLFNVYKDELDEVKKLVVDIMENTYKLNVPLLVDVNVGKDWCDAK